jgi:methionyl aminopeptidase
MMRVAGKIVARALDLCREMVRPGVKTIDLDHAVEELFVKEGAKSLFKGYPGRVPFPAVTCISVNEQVVHGIPGSRALAEGEIVKIDTACSVDGWCADAAVSLPVGEISQEKSRLIREGEEILQLAMESMAHSSWWSEVAQAMQAKAKRAGFSMVTQYVGHGIGRTMHEVPQVPNYWHNSMKKTDFRLEPGVVLAVEPMVNMGGHLCDTLRDHWTVVTRDGLPSVHVEHTVAVLEQGIYVITAREETWIPGPGGKSLAGA